LIRFAYHREEGKHWTNVSSFGKIEIGAKRHVLENCAFERHYRIGDLARLWGLGRETVRKLVKDDPAVVKVRLGRKKAHTIYSVPESAARRIHTRLVGAA
jgi:hypothetical protein